MIYSDDAERELYELIDWFIENTKGEQAVCATKPEQKGNLQA